MIKAAVIKKSGLLDVLADADKIAKQVKALEAQEKKAKAELKKLFEGKSLAKAKADLAKELEVAEKKLADAKNEAVRILHKAEKEAEEEQKRLDDELAHAKQLSAQLKKELADARAKRAEAQDLLKAAEKEFVTASGEKASAAKLKAQYEAKVEDLKNRLAGL